MTCEELRNLISAYADDELASCARASCDEHFASCPLCRTELAETKLLRRRLAALPRTPAPAGLARQISDRLATERAVLAERERSKPRELTPAAVLRSLAPRLMPLSIGAAASVLLFVAVFGALVPTMRTLHVLEQASLIEFGSHGDALASAEGGYDVTQPITAADYVASRSPYTSVSPSLDPRGALVTGALASHDARRSADTGDDEMLVVADVYSDGQASLAEVVSPPRDSRMLDDLQAALRRTPAFVPSRMDNRPPTMRVVFMVQRLDVRATTY